VRESRVATADWWDKHGISRTTLRALVRSGDLVRTRHGVYATKAAQDEADADPRAEHAFRVKSAIAVVGQDAVACCSSAALIHGLELLTAPPADVVTLLRPAARERNRRSSGDIVFRAGALVPAGDRERQHVIRSYGVRVTTAPRTVADLARELPLIDGVVVADSALRKFSFWKDAYVRILESCNGWPGLKQARKTLEFADPKAESVLESALRVRLHEWGFAPPETQVPLDVASRSVRVDFLYEEHKTVIEADGTAKLSEENANQKQDRRDQSLRDAGYKVVHVRWRELFYEPDLVIGRIRRAFAAPSVF
jgi:very-short-patch-repair endonuclease